MASSGREGMQPCVWNLLEMKVSSARHARRSAKKYFYLVSAYLFQFSVPSVPEKECGDPGPARFSLISLPPSPQPSNYGRSTSRQGDPVSTLHSGSPYSPLLVIVAHHDP